jgi:hypothetical protein
MKHGSTNLLAIVNVVDSTVDNKDAFQEVTAYCVAGKKQISGQGKNEHGDVGLSPDCTSPPYLQAHVPRRLQH